MPINFNFESQLKKKRGYKLIAGIDEVGRGPLAGPVTAAAFMFLTMPPKSNLKFLRDSKLLSPKQREELYGYFHFLKEEGSVVFSTASVFPKTIDKRKIHHAVILAMRRAVEKLEPFPDHAIIDGFRYQGKMLNRPVYTAMFKADMRVPSVAAASIIAKVKRDRTMLRYHQKYPQYRFDLHKGYGTALHYKALSEHGPSPIHRQSFRLK